MVTSHNIFPFMPATLIIALAVLIFIVALLYSTVGHAGASGYLAAMALFSISPLAMKPTALVLNILVAIIGTVRFYRAGFFSWRIFWPFILTSIPASFIGGALSLPVPIYKSIVGFVLLYSAVRLFFTASQADQGKVTHAPILAALLIGAVIGLLSGLTGVGGGIFLSPVLLIMHWARTKDTSGVAVAFILVNSIAGLLGHVSSLALVPTEILYWAPAALIGGWIGTLLGTRVLPIAGIRRWLSVVLVLAGVKLLWEAAVILLHR
jgi:hypothetical protein